MRHELVDGALRTLAPAGGEHGRIGARLLIRIGVFVEAQRLGEVFTAGTGFWLRRNPDTVRAPDVAFVRAERLPSKPDEVVFYRLAPDLVVEVVSPFDRRTEVTAKVMMWLDAGVRDVA